MVVHVLAITLSLGAPIWSFFDPRWAWAPLIVVAALLGLVLASVKSQKWQYIPELSPQANELFQRFGHFYTRPFAGRDFSGACSTLQFGAVAVAVVGLFKGFWWGAGIAAAFWFGVGPMAMAFNPTNFLADPVLRTAHQEIIDWITARSRERSGGV